MKINFIEDWLALGIMLVGLIGMAIIFALIATGHINGNQKWDDHCANVCKMWQAGEVVVMPTENFRECMEARH